MVNFTCAVSHRISASVCFNAVRFQPATASHLLLAFIELVLVERLPIRTAFPDMLGQSYKLGRHSDVFLILRKDDISLDITKFVWTHSSLRPWGQYLPVQCPQCGWTNAWASVHQNKLYAFECKNDQCKKRYEFMPPPNSRILLPGKAPGTCWISIPLETTLPASD